MLIAPGNLCDLPASNVVDLIQLGGIGQVSFRPEEVDQNHELCGWMDLGELSPESNR
jgi:hypothetical protein